MHIRRSTAGHIAATVSIVLVVAASFVLGPAGTASAKTASATAKTVTPADDCSAPTLPDWFHDDLVAAIGYATDIPASWASAPEVGSIACWQGTAYSATFDSIGDAYHEWHGIFAMTVQEATIVQGPSWMINGTGKFTLNMKCFVWGWTKCTRTTQNSRVNQQDIAALRWIWLNYGSPSAAWASVTGSGAGRFDSYPRPGTTDTSTKTPFSMCPVAGSVSYSDDFGAPRTVGGFHPHWGIDMLAAKNQAIRAPFDGLAVSHSDNWFAGNYVTIVGAKGYVRNGHLDHFGTLGYVTAGTVIGYVGETGDATVTHDHFEWHPWVVATPLHVSPYGYSRINDAVDPYTFLNLVCTSAGAVPALTEATMGD